MTERPERIALRFEDGPHANTTRVVAIGWPAPEIVRWQGGVYERVDTLVGPLQDGVARGATYRWKPD